MLQIPKLTSILVACCCLQVAESRDQLRAERTSAEGVVDARGEIKVHGVPSEPLTSLEIKDAFHEPAVVMEEVQRLRSLGLIEAVQAIVEGTAKLAVGHKPTSAIIDENAEKFAVAMRGYTFLDIGDSQRPENVRYRKSLYVAAIASLSAEAQARAASTLVEGSEEYA